jgi:lysophospholipase L1-like esterase
MKQYDIQTADPLMVHHGRVLLEPQSNVLHFNWTASGVELLFCGTSLSAVFQADCGEEIEGAPWDEAAPRRKTWPWVAVFMDDDETPSRRFEVQGNEQSWLLFQSEQPQTHRIRIVKLTENLKTFLGLCGFWAQGTLLEYPKKQRDQPTVEFVGDSITCGYGNGSTERDRPFFSAEEDGWLAHGAMAARMLGMEYRCVCISGITVARRKAFPLPYAMDELYLYTDKIQQQKNAPQMPANRWDFRANPNDVVVINLGTNDAAAIVFSGDNTQEAAFEQDYINFLDMVRKANGPRTQIICALGSMNYYLYHNVLQAVRRYQQQTGDTKISCYKYRQMSFMDGFGASGHPSMVTQQKMAQEIATVISGFLPQRKHPNTGRKQEKK